MITTLLTAAAVAVAPLQAHPCRAPLPHGPAVPAPIVLWTSCGAFRLAADGQVSRMPRHWLAKHSGGTGRRYGAHLDIRRSHSGRFLLVLRGHVIWRSTGLYPGDGGGVDFGPHSFAFASYRRGVFVTDLRSAERLVARGRGLYPYSFTSSGDLFVSGTRAITLISPTGATLRRFRYRAGNGYSFDEQTDVLYYVTPSGRLAAAHDTRVELKRTLVGVDGMISVARPNLLVFSGSHSITATSRDGTVIATTRWSSHLNSDSGVSVSGDGKSFAFRLSDARPGSRSGTATVYLLKAGARHAQAIYQHHLGASGCAVGAGFSWHGSSLLYSSSDGTLTLLDTRTRTATSLSSLAKTLPRGSAGERAQATWRSNFHW